MEKSKKLPKRLYKYRDFSPRTLDMILGDKLYFADPSTFNDPLDTQPSLEADLDVVELEEILRIFVERRTNAEMNAAAIAIKYRGPKTMDHIERHSRQQAKKFMQRMEFFKTELEYEPEAYKYALMYYIEEELLRQYDKGIVSLARSAISPLMWSHYSDQHRGICVGYSVPTDTADDVHKVEYGGSRLVEASKVAAMLGGDEAARSDVDDAVLLRKAQNWSYEREWRLIGRRGLHDSPLELEEIVFGMRCENSVKYTIMKALEDRQPPIKFSEVDEIPGRFNLKRHALNPKDDQLFVYFPHQWRSWVNFNESSK